MEQLMKMIGGLTAEGCTHLVCATGGSMVPEQEMKQYYQTGSTLLKKREDSL